MLLVHGCPATRTLWAPLVPMLSQSATVYAIDLPGFGESPAPTNAADLQIPSLVSTLLAFADSHGIDRFDIVGHSYGGALAASVAASAPERIRTLVMLTPMGFSMPPAARAARMPIARAIIDPLWRITPRFLRRALIRTSTRINYGPAYQPARAVQLSRELDRGDIVHASFDLIGAFDFAEYRKTIDVLNQSHGMVMTAIGARRDRIVPYGHFEQLSTALGECEHITFDDGVHVVMWQYPREVAQCIVNAIERSAAEIATEPIRG